MEIEELKEMIRKEVDLEMYRINDMVGDVIQAVIEEVEFKEPSTTVEEGEVLDIAKLVIEEIERYVKETDWNSILKLIPEEIRKRLLEEY